MERIWPGLQTFFLPQHIFTTRVNLCLGPAVLVSRAAEINKFYLS